MKINFEIKIKEWDRYIREGKGGVARQEMKALENAKVPRPLAAILGGLAWRAGLAPLGIRILNPVVRPKEKAPVVASVLEQAEYAACLIKIGAVEEGRQLLKDLPAETLPQVYLYRAFATVTEWDYRASIPLLVAYLNNPRLSKYQRVVGQVNLAAAYVYEKQFQKAEYLLRHLLYESSVKRSVLALGRVLELSAENFIAQKKWAKAEEFLARAESVLRHSDGIDLFFVKKFRAVAAVSRNPASAHGWELFNEVRHDARFLRHWETVRDCDRIEAILRSDAKLFAHVYFGTPYSGFHSRMEDDAKAGIVTPSAYDWRPKGGKSGPVVDVWSGLVQGSKNGLKEGQAVHRLLLALTSDFYRPFRTPAIHSALYPEEYYHPIHSPVKVRQVILRLRAWFDEEELPLVIEEENGNYRLVAQGACVLHLRRRGAKHAKERSDLVVDKLRDRFAGAGFSAAEAAAFLRLTPRSLQRILEKAIEDNLVVRTGKGKATRYHFPLQATG